MSITKAFSVDCCNECPYIEQMWTGEYRRAERVWYCANSETHFLILSQDRFKIHEWCEGEDLEVLLEREYLMKLIEDRLDGCV
jgi:hypothetical protein